MTLRLAHDADANVEALDVRNYMDLPAMARSLATELEANAYGDVRRILIVIDNEDGLNTLTWGHCLSSYEAVGMLDAAKLIALQQHFETD